MNRPRGALEPYLHEIAKTPLLTAAQEKELGRKIQKGDTEAKEQLVKANLRFVVNVAKRYQNKGLSLDDLIQEGNLGLIEAATQYDPSFENRFTTYAQWWIAQKIKNALIRSREIRTPNYMVTLVKKWKHAAALLLSSTGEEPHPDAVGKQLGLSAKKQKLVQEALRLDQAHANTGTPEDMPLEDLMEDPHTADEAEHHDDLQSLHEGLRKLPALDAQVVQAHAEGKPLREIAKDVHRSVEGVRQIETRALMLLRKLMHV